MENNTQHIISYLENTLSAEERKSFEDLLNESPELRQELDDIRFVWENSKELKIHKQIDASKNWDELSGKITVDKYKRKLWYFTRSMAAILAVPLILATAVLFRTIKERDNMPVEQIELDSANGLISKIRLPDGTEVWLNSGSKLSYPRYFTGDTRQVSFSGEAYFKVKADDANRFEVMTNEGLIVSAFGTEFNVCAYEEDSVIEATLVSGNIEVAMLADGRQDVLNMSEGQQVKLDKSNGKLEVKDVNLFVKTSWKDGKMIFRRASMDEIVRRLSRHFNVNIYLEGKDLHDYEYSASFTTETLEEILYLLEKSAPITCKIIYPKQSEDYTYTKKTVIISMK